MSPQPEADASSLDCKNRINMLQKQFQRKTKILCTIGPVTNSPEIIQQLLDAGMDAARLNFSHGDYQTHRSALEAIRQSAVDRELFIPVIQDLQGPKIRTGRLATHSVTLVAGSSLTITTEDILGTAERISTTYADLPNDVKPGDRILINDGLIELKVRDVRKGEILCTIVNGGELGEHKGMNFPGARLSAPALTEKDKEDLAFGIEIGVDAVALSFVRRAEDIQDLRTSLGSFRASLPIIAKIEKPEAISDIDRIIEAADAIMIARGDLGVEMPTEDVPMLQKMIIHRANRAGKPVIVATQMLESMVNEPRPTRAEATDVANAVLDGSDVLMLSAETALGKYPVEAVRTMAKIIAKAEAEGIAHPDIPILPETDSHETTEAVAHAACLLAEQIDAAAIIAVTHTGTTARLLSRYRPHVPIIAVTDSPHVARWTQLFWGVQGIVVPWRLSASNTDETLKNLEILLVQKGFVHSGDKLVFTAGIPVPAKGSTNMVKVARVG